MTEVMEKKEVVRSKHTGYPTSDGESRNAEWGYASDQLRIADLRKRVDLIEEMMKENHKAIDACGALLNKSQPPMSGKMEVRWWTNSGAGSYKHQPTVVLWSGKKGMPKAIKPTGLANKVGTVGKFQNNYDDSCRLASILEDLMNSRALLLKYIKDFNLTVTSFKTYSHADLTRMKEFGGGKGVFHFIEDRIDAVSAVEAAKKLAQIELEEGVM